ncbi:MAG: hypothetical protein N0C88_21750 [Candidatus Thiodiazotropha lotti]|uniref:Uncharacterized protein n=1 Tax=Candidatus Thiodiazotropha lotti TaxID=2792787 RepID=A0A9E4K7V6_9GAMM|nr:hypothetical protein [Candidatus Thiodiazotropha lotti]MCW4205930.1 hypothetical protein [Candidatus Thiodiazotropha lotti]
MESGKLTPEAETAVRKYMLHLVSLPAILGSVIMFVMGYLVNEVASGRAYNEAYKEASEKVLSFTEQAALAAHDADRTKQDIEQIRVELDSIRTEAIEIRGKLKTAQAFQSSENIVSEVTKSLANRKDFKDSILAITEKQLADINRRVESAHSRINGVRLHVTRKSVSPQFACGGEQKENGNNLMVMYGSRDGTSCGVHNLNYYKEIGLSIPAQ